jgi:uncharacterized protein DUF6343
MAIDEPGGSRPRHSPEEGRRDYADYHDPLAGFAGAPPAHSALTLRLVLATFGLAVCTAAAAGLASAGGPVALVVVAGLLAAVAAVDIVVIVRRKRRGEPG